MSHPAFFSEHIGGEGGELILSPEESHHLGRVLRLRRGEEVVVFDGKGGMAEGTILRNHPRSAVIRIRRYVRQVPKQPTFRLWCAPPRTSDRLHWLIEKCTELGVSEIQLIITQRTVRHRANLERLRRIAINAIKQSHNPFLPVIGAPQPLNKLSLPSGLNLWGDPAGAPLSHALEGMNAAAITLVIGPEGGLTAEETDFLRHQAFVPVRLASHTLRIETAAIVGAAIVRLYYS